MECEESFATSQNAVARPKLSDFIALAINSEMQGESVSKHEPSLEEVLSYMDGQMDFRLKPRLRMPHEHQKEIRQIGALWVLEHFSEILPDGWRSFVQKRCFGIVKDYLRDGAGFEETAIRIAETTKQRKVEREQKEGNIGDMSKKDIKADAVPLSSRLQIRDKETGESLGPDAIADIFGISAAEPEREIFFVSNQFGEIEEISFNPKWELIERMASEDLHIHLVGKLLKGTTLTDQAEEFEVSRVRLSQRIREWWASLDAAENIGKGWIEQTIYAFGLNEYFNMPDNDNGLGWSLPRIDLGGEFSISRMLYRMDEMFPEEKVVKRPEIPDEFRAPAKSSAKDRSEQLMLWDILSLGPRH